MSFAARLKDLRLRSGKSLQELADALEISKAHLWDLETGRSSNPSSDILKKISDHFEVSIAGLLGEDVEAGEEEMRVMFRQLQDLDPNDREIIKAVIATQNKQKKSGGDND